MLAVQSRFSYPTHEGGFYQGGRLPFTMTPGSPRARGPRGLGSESFQFKSRAAAWPRPSARDRPNAERTDWGRAG